MKTVVDTNEQLKVVKEASRKLLLSSNDERNKALSLISKELEKSKDKIIRANEKDIEEGKKNNLTSALIDRLLLNDKRLSGMSTCLEKIIKLEDPVGKVIRSWKHEDGMQMEKITTPLGVVCVIYEARPNVTTDAVGLAIKSGNAVVLRGSQHAFYSNGAIVEVVKEALCKSSISPDVVQFIASKDRAETIKVLEAKEYVDLIIPRGGEELKDFVMKNSKIPVIGAGGGTCHLFIDESANKENAINIAVNAKTQRPGVCNAIETILVHKNIASSILSDLEKALLEKGVELFGCANSKKILPNISAATDEDWQKEYLDLKIAVKVVSSIDEAIDHINTFGTLHSESIVTEEEKNAKRFQLEVDASSVYVNVSTRYTDGEEFGLGAEMGISTQKLHARGPVALEGLVTYKYLITGNGQVRK